MKTLIIDTLKKAKRSLSVKDLAVLTDENPVGIGSEVTKSPATFQARYLTKRVPRSNSRGYIYSTIIVVDLHPHLANYVEGYTKLPDSEFYAS